MTSVVAAASALFGLLVGSFLNVVIYRVPRRESVVQPRSRCPGCGSTLAARDNVPIVSWLLLRGRCRSCGTPISSRYPLIEGATAGLFFAVGLKFGADWALPGFLMFAAILLAVAVIDLEHLIVPNKLVIAALALGVPLLVAAAALDDEWDSLVRGLIGAVAACGSLLVMNLVNPRWMGMGDVKLALVLGLFLGWLGLGFVAAGLFLGFLLGAVGGILLIALKIRSRKDHIPFAPFLAGGAILAVLVGSTIIDWYTV